MPTIEGTNSSATLNAGYSLAFSSNSSAANRRNAAYSSQAYTVEISSKGKQSAIDAGLNNNMKQAAFERGQDQRRLEFQRHKKTEEQDFKRNQRQDEINFKQKMQQEEAEFNRKLRQEEAAFKHKQQRAAAELVKERVSIEEAT